MTLLARRAKPSHLAMLIKDLKPHTQPGVVAALAVGPHQASAQLTTRCGLAGVGLQGARGNSGETHRQHIGAQVVQPQTAVSGQCSSLVALIIPNTCTT